MFSFERLVVAKLWFLIMGSVFLEAISVVDHCSNLELVEWTWGSNMIAL